MINKLSDIIVNGITIKTSGSSGVPKEIYQKPSKIIADAKNAIEVQNINEFSSIYTCLSLERAGGLFAQSIPGLLANATIDFDTFDPYKYARMADKYTHTHLTPKQAKAVMLTKKFKTLNLKGKTFLIGSEPVTWDIIDAFIEKGCIVITIWGMTEVGPNAILHKFESVSDIIAAKAKCPLNSSILGNIFYCDWKIIDDCLWVRGDTCVYDDWFNTKDLVIEKDGLLFYKGRLDTTVDFKNPRKG